MIWEGFEIQLERKPRRRSLSIYVKPTGDVIVRAAMSVREDQIRKFLDLKKDWILKHIQKFEEAAAQNPPKTLSHAETFPFLGKNLSLKYLPTPLKTGFFSRSEDHLNLHLPENVWRDISEDDLSQYWKQLFAFYEREAKKLITERVEVWAHHTGLNPKKLSFRNQKTRWGSCSSRGTVTLNWRLIAAPLDVIDYLILHELSHLEHMNHSAKFWALVEKHDPDYRDKEAWLKNHHHTLDFLKVPAN